MKARVKATGEIVEVKIIDQLSEEEMYVEKFGEMSGRVFHITELDFDNLDYPDYWTRLEHQAAIAAMGGICGNTSYDESTWESMAEDAIWAAHVLVQKMKEVKYG